MSFYFYPIGVLDEVILKQGFVYSDIFRAIANEDNQ